MALCNDFPGLTPFIIRDTDADEVFLLLSRRRKYIAVKNNAQTFTKETRRKIDPRNATWLC